MSRPTNVEAFRFAAKFWRNIIGAKTTNHHNGDYGVTGMMAYVMQADLRDMAGQLTEEVLQKFEDNLVAWLSDTSKFGNWGIRCDYGPDICLFESLRDAFGPCTCDKLPVKKEEIYDKKTGKHTATRFFFCDICKCAQNYQFHFPTKAGMSISNVLIRAYVGDGARYENVWGHRYSVEDVTDGFRYDDRRDQKVTFFAYDWKEKRRMYEHSYVRPKFPVTQGNWFKDDEARALCDKWSADDRAAIDKAIADCKAYLTTNFPGWDSETEIPYPLHEVAAVV